MPTRATDGQTDFSGGVRFGVSQADVPENGMIACTEGRVDVNGGVSRRLGTQKLHASAIGGASGIQTLYGVTRDNNASVDLYALGLDGHMYTSGDLGVIPMAWTDLGATGASLVTTTTMANFRDATQQVVYVGDSGGAISKTTSALYTSRIAGAATCNVLAVYNRRLFGLLWKGVGDTANTLYWSALDNGDTLGAAASGGGTAIIRTFGKAGLTGLRVLGGSLMLFHFSGISRFTGWGQDDIAVDAGAQTVTSSVGCQHPNRSVVFEGVCYFVGTDGHVYAMTESAHPQCLTRGKLTATQRGNLVATTWPLVVHPAYRELWVPGPSPDGAFVLQLDVGAWTTFPAMIPTNATTAAFAGAAPYVLGSVQASPGFVQDLSTGQLDGVASNGTGGSAVTLRMRGHPLTFEQASRLKSARFGTVTGNLPGTGTVALLDDSGTTVSSASIGPTTGDLATVRWQASGQGSALSVQYTDSNTVGTPRISELSVEGFVLNRPGG